MSLPSTTKLLAEIVTQDATQLLNAVQFDINPPSGTMIPVLDDLLLQSRRLSEGLDASHAFHRGDLVEINGPSGSGKTELLYHMILHRILPASHTFTPYSPNTLRRFSTPVSFSGLKQTCLVYSLTSGGFSLVRLAELVRAQLFMAYTKAAEETWPNARGRTEWKGIQDDMARLVRECLRRVRVAVISGGSSWGLAVALSRFKEVVLEELEDDEELGFVGIDGFGEGFWQDKYAYDIKLTLRKASLSSREVPEEPSDQLDPPPPPARPPPIPLLDRLPSPMHQIMTALTTIRHTYAPLMALTTQQLVFNSQAPSASTSRATASSGPGPAGASVHLQPSPFARPHLPYPYVNPFVDPNAPPGSRPRTLPLGMRGITHHITLLPLVGPKINPAYRLNDVLRLEETRAKRLKMRGVLRIVGGDTGNDGFASDGRRWEVWLDARGISTD